MLQVIQSLMLDCVPASAQLCRKGLIMTGAMHLEMAQMSMADLGHAAHSTTQQGDHFHVTSQSVWKEVCYLHDPLRQVPWVYTTRSKVVVHLVSALHDVRSCLRSLQDSVLV